MHQSGDHKGGVAQSGDPESSDFRTSYGWVCSTRVSDTETRGEAKCFRRGVNSCLRSVNGIGSLVLLFSPFLAHSTDTFTS